LRGSDRDINVALLRSGFGGSLVAFVGTTLPECLIMGVRRENRLYLRLPVRICGVDVQGEAFEQDATTFDLTATGVRLQGITHDLKRGGIVSIEYRGSKASFKVRWVGMPQTALQGQVGLKLIERETMNWGRTIPCIPGDAFVGQENTDEYRNKILAKAVRSLLH
jgi:hypothetical protein